MGPQPLWERVRKCEKNTKNKKRIRINQQLLNITKKAVVEGENDTKEIEKNEFSIKKIRLALARIIIVD